MNSFDKIYPQESSKQLKDILLSIQVKAETQFTQYMQACVGHKLYFGQNKNLPRSNPMVYFRFRITDTNKEPLGSGSLMRSTTSLQLEGQGLSQSIQSFHIVQSFWDLSMENAT